jgi:prepilin-type N-terminal cleavage/methylation domain-containing protein
MHDTRRTTNGRFRGLTLMELVVVMAILVAIAAILVPLLPEYLGKANQSAAATNMSELEKAIQTFRTTYSRYPNYFDSMLTSSNAKPSYVSQPKDGDTNLMTVGTLSDTQFQRLSRQGIKQVYNLTSNTTGTDFHATLNPYGAQLPLASGSSVWKLARTAGDGGYNDEVFNRGVLPGMIMNNDHDYVLLGIGKYCNLCGPDGLVKEAPVFGQHKSQNTPSTSYQRYVAVFDVGSATDTDLMKPAKFVSIVALQGKRFFTAGDLVGTYGDNSFDLTTPAK